MLETAVTAKRKRGREREVEGERERGRGVQPVSPIDNPLPLVAEPETGGWGGGVFICSVSVMLAMGVMMSASVTALIVF